MRLFLIAPNVLPDICLDMPAWHEKGIQISLKRNWGKRSSSGWELTLMLLLRILKEESKKEKPG
jgi:hypothetical protein